MTNIEGLEVTNEQAAMVELAQELTRSGAVKINTINRDRMFRDDPGWTPRDLTRDEVGMLVTALLVAAAQPTPVLNQTPR